jgi:hypothetical protein
MPTIIGCDNFLHRNFDNLALPVTTTKRIWSVVDTPANISFDTGKTRDGRGFAKILGTGTGAIVRLRKALAAGTRVLTWSVYFIVDAAPSVKSAIAFGSAGTTGGVFMATNGSITYDINGSSSQTIAGNYADGLVHRLDARFDTSGATHLLDVSIDGTAGTQSSFGSSAGDITAIGLGKIAGTETLTVWLQDLVWSVTSADHPIGDHYVRPLYPNGDGTHAASITAGDFDKADGTDILTSTTDAWTEIDDWITGAADTTTYIQDTAGASTEYTEHTFDDTNKVPWNVSGYAACFASSATLCTLGVRFVDSGGTTLTDLLADEDVSELTLRYWFASIAAPGGSWDATKVSGVKVRIGLSTDVAPDPRCSAVMMMMAVPGDADSLAVPRTDPSLPSRDFDPWSVTGWL